MQVKIWVYLWTWQMKFKGIVHSEMKICRKPSGHPRCRWVCFFIWTDLEKCSITSLAHQWMLCSEWVPSEWESKQMIKTIHTIIPTSPVHQLMSWEAKNCIQTNPSLSSFNFKPSLLTKICCPLTSKSSLNRLQTVLDLCIFLSWFIPDGFFTEERNIMHRGLVF